MIIVDTDPATKITTTQVTTMNNTRNTNLPVQSSIAPSTNIVAIDSANTTMAINRQTQRPAHETSSTFQRRRAGRSGHRGRAAAAATRRQQIDHQANIGHSSLIDSPESKPIVNEECSNDTNHLVSSPTNQRGHQRGRGRPGSGKYRQRHNTNQFINGIDSHTGLDIDLVESLVPSSSTSQNLDTGKKRRHVTNSRKMNLTHLLNSKYESNNHRNRYNQPSTNHQRHPGSQYRDSGTNHKFSKQQFLQANCQFVVSDGHDYTIHKVDSDHPVDWNCIEEVRFMQSACSETTCPICLEPPIAAKITRCGHIYCWTCMLHYLSLSDENCRQCPICFEPVYKSDLRSVISHSFANYTVDEEITMRLMVRKKGCVEAEPYTVDQISALSQLETNDNSAAQSWPRTNLVIVDPQTVVSKIIQRERAELLFKLRLDKDEPEVCFVEQALGILERRVSKLLNNQVTDQSRTKTIEFGIGSSNQTQDLEPMKTYLFYQCADGQHIYLNPFSTKILCHQFGSLENSPPELSAKILQMDWISMNEAWRRRFRYLAHLPLTCEFRLIEIDFVDSQLISNSTYKYFEEQIKWREQERQKRLREERKRDKIIQVQQNRRIYGIQPSLKINLNNIDQFPSVSDERYLGLTQPRSRTKSDEEFYYSSEDELVNTSPLTERVTTEASKDDGSDLSQSNKNEAPEEAINIMAMSFRDIQLQEAALEAKKQGERPTTSQVTKGQSKTAYPNTQSSFAQLLVGAKTSQKKWTKNVASTPKAQLSGQQMSSSGSRQISTLGGSDAENEELRAPPYGCTISDFIDMNIVTNPNKKKGKLRNGVRKSGQ